jgi:hypothetical protein
MADELVTIAEYPDSMQAELTMQVLADYGIKAILMGQHAADVYGGVPAFAMVKLQVRQGDADEARQILESQQDSDDTGELEEEEEQEQ